MRGDWLGCLLCHSARSEALVARSSGSSHATAESGFGAPRRTTQLNVIVAEPGALIPEENPHANIQAISRSGVPYSRVKGGLDVLFPPAELDQRTALSRTDGYWPFLQKGRDPPKEFTYGEFDVDWFASLLDLVYDELQKGQDERKEQVFVDIGSGTGRLVFAAAALHPSWFRQCRGIELLPGIHQAAQDHLDGLRKKCIGDTFPVLPSQPTLPMAPIEFVCGSFEDPYVSFADADVVFFFTTCLPETLLASFAQAVARQCKPGTFVVTTDYVLPLEGTVPPVDGDDRIPSGPYKLDFVGEVAGWSWVQGGDSAAYIHRLAVCPWEESRQGPWERPKLSAGEMAFRAAMLLESGDIETEAFLRGAYNNMVFHGLPERWYARLRDRLQQT